MRRLLLISLLSLCASAASAETAAPFYRRYTGMLGSDTAIVMHVAYWKAGEKSPTDVEGHYFYTKYGANIPLSGTYDGKTLHMSEDHGVFDLTVNVDTVTGSWKSTDGKKVLPVSLTEDYAGAVKFSVYLSLETQKREPAGKPPLKDESSLLWLVPTATPVADQLPAVQRFVRNCLGMAEVLNEEDAAATPDGKKPPKPSCETLPAKGDAAGLAKQATAKFFQDAHADDDHSWAQAEAAHVEQNDDGILALSFDLDGYTGGAHGSHATTARTFDVTKGHVVHTADLFSDGTSEKIQALLEQRYRTDQKLDAGTKLKGDGGLLVDTIPLTDNFYLDRAGITFVYPPYDIAPWAAGQIEISLTWKVLQPHLKTDALAQKFLK